MKLKLIFWWIKGHRGEKRFLGALVVCSVLGLIGLSPNSVLGTCQDIDPNSEEYMDDGHVVHCRCRQGYAKWNGHCRLVEEVRTRLQEKVQNAQAGGRAALYAYSNLVVGELASKAVGALRAVDLLALAKGPDFKQQVVKAEIKLAEVLAGLGDCNQSNSEIKVACQNIKTFQRIVADTRADLDKLPPTTHR